MGHAGLSVECISKSSADCSYLRRVSVASTDSVEEEMDDDVVLTKNIDDKVVETSGCRLRCHRHHADELLLQSTCSDCTDSGPAMYLYPVLRLMHTDCALQP